MTYKEAIEMLDYIVYCNDYKNCREKIAIDMAKAALEKQIPIKPIYSDYDDNGYNSKLIPYKAKCPICEHEFEFGYWNDEDNHHCVCGQKMNWR